MTTEYTKNFRLNLPDFRMGPWHDLVNQDFITIDELILSVIQGVDTRVWTNNFDFAVGMTAIDPTDNTFWVCSVNHTSAPLPTTFAQDRAAHPTYWARVVVGVAPRGEWKNSTHYLPNDMVNDSNEGVIAVCITEHTSSPAPATIRADAVYWSFIADMHTSGDARFVIYHNDVSGVPATTVQQALDLCFATDKTQNTNIAKNTTDVTALTTRVTAVEGVNTTQTNNILTNTGDIANLDNRIDTIEGAGYITDAPADGTVYGRKDHTWSAAAAGSTVLPATVVPIVESGTGAVGTSLKYAREDHVHPLGPGGGGSPVLSSDTPPIGAPDNALWLETDTGILYFRWNDGNSTQWVAIGQGGSGGIRFDQAQNLSPAQQTQGRQNIYAAPFDAMAYSGMQVNGNFIIDQINSGAAYSFPAGASLFAYVMDGWAVNKVGTGTLAFTVQQVQSYPAGFISQMKITVTAAQPSVGSDQIQIQQRIEGYRFAKAGWGTAGAQPVTVGFWVWSSVAGTLPIQISDGTNVASASVTITTAGAVQWCTVTLSPPAAWVGSIGNGVGAYLLIFPMSAGGINIASANGNQFNLTGVVVLPGIEAPSAARSQLIMRPYDQELLTCQRYWEADNVTVQAAAIGVQVSQYPFKVSKRAVPTMTTFGTPTFSGTSSPGYVGTTVGQTGLQFSTTALNGYVANWTFKADARL